MAKPDWQNQSFAKNSSASKANPGSAEKKFSAPPGFSQFHSTPTGVNETGDAGAVQYLADGGSVGLWERLKAGNIDQPGSEAYNRWGQGAKDGIASSDARQLARNNAATADAASPSPAPAPAANTGGGDWGPDPREIDYSVGSGSSTSASGASASPAPAVSKPKRMAMSASPAPAPAAAPIVSKAPTPVLTPPPVSPAAGTSSDVGVVPGKSWFTSGGTVRNEAADAPAPSLKRVAGRGFVRS